MATPTADSSGLSSDNPGITADGGAYPPVGITVDDPNITADNPNYTADGGYSGPINLIRVQAVSCGWYNDNFYEIGDVFQLLNNRDFSDSTVNYGPFSATTQYGWMQQVPNSMPLYTARSSGITSSGTWLPVNEINRRTVY